MRFMVRLSALALLLSFFAMSVTAGGPSGAAVPAASQSVAEFQGCALGATRPVDVLIVMDQTQSLRTTDPNNLRIIGLKAALRSMASEHDTNPNVSYRVRMVGFGRQVIQYSDGPGLGSFTAVTADSLQRLYASTGKFLQPAPNDLGTVTDFSSALRFADQELVKSPSPCRAVLWFTDGALDLSNNGELFPRTSLEKAAMSDICRPGGLTASLAGDNIWNFVVGLTNQTGDLGARALASVTRGGSSNYLYSGPCGSSSNGQAPAGASGEFFESPNSASLIFQMQGLVCTGAGCEPRPQEPCVRGELCPANHQFPFWVGPGVGSFTFDGLVKSTPQSSNNQQNIHPQFQITDASSNESLVISMSNGRQACALPNGTSTPCVIDGVRISASSLAANEIRIIGRVTNAVGPGHKLRGVFLLPSGVDGTVQYTFFLKSSIDLSFVPSANGTPECPATNGENAYVGCTVNGTIVLVDATSHKPVTSNHAVLRNVHASLVSNKQDVIPVDIASTTGSAISYSISIPNSATIGVRYLQAFGVLDLSQGGVQQASIDVSLQQPLSLIPAPGFPTVAAPSKAALTNVGTDFSIPIRITGSARGDGGCVGLGDFKMSLSVPPGTEVKSLRTDIPRSCRTIGAAHTVVYHVRGQLTKGNNGQFGITVPLRLGSGDSHANFEAPSVVVSVQANVPVNVSGSIVLLIVFLILALLGILGMSLLVNMVTGRFAPRNMILTKTVSVKFTNSGMHMIDGSPLNFGDFLSDNVVDLSGSRLRTFSAPGGNTALKFTAANLRKPLTWVSGLFRGPMATVEAGKTLLVVGGHSRKVEGPTANGCSVPQDLNEFWIFSVDSIAGADATPAEGSLVASEPFVVTGSLTAFVRSGGGTEAVARVVNSVHTQMIDAGKRFATMSVPTSAPSSSSGSSSSSPVSQPPVTPTTVVEDDGSFSI